MTDPVDLDCTWLELEETEINALLLGGLYPELDQESLCPYESCPLSEPERAKMSGFDLSELIIHLNDDEHNWTREEIADWLEKRT